MASRLKLGLLLLPLALCLCVAVDTPAGFLPRTEVVGLTEPAPKPTFSWASLWAGEYQTRFEAWFESALTFRAELVRTDNTLETEMLGELSPNAGILLGHERTLFGLDQINNYNGVSHLKGDMPARSPEEPEVSARRLGAVSRAFEQLGVDFVMVFYPLKPVLHAAKLPDRFRLPGGPDRAARGYERFLRQLRENGVPTIDGVAIARELQQTTELPTWNRGGLHWTDALACAVMQQIIAEVRRQTLHRGGVEAQPPPDFRCQPLSAVPARGGDMDLADLSNVWNPEVYADAIPPVQPLLVRGLPGGRRDALFIGTSFSRQLTRLIRAGRAARAVQYIPYYRVSNRAGLVLPRDIQGRRLVVMEQWQWAYLTINNSEFIDTLEREVPGFTELMRNPPPRSGD